MSALWYSSHGAIRSTLHKCTRLPRVTVSTFYDVEVSGESILYIISSPCIWDLPLSSASDVLRTFDLQFVSVHLTTRKPQESYNSGITPLSHAYARTLFSVLTEWEVPFIVRRAFYLASIYLHVALSNAA